MPSSNWDMGQILGAKRPNFGAVDAVLGNFGKVFKRFITKMHCLVTFIILESSVGISFNYAV